MADRFSIGPALEVPRRDRRDQALRSGVVVNASTNRPRQRAATQKSQIWAAEPFRGRVVDANAWAPRRSSVHNAKEACELLSSLGMTEFWDGVWNAFTSAAERANERSEAVRRGYRVLPYRRANDHFPLACGVSYLHDEPEIDERLVLSLGFHRSSGQIRGVIDLARAGRTVLVEEEVLPGRPEDAGLHGLLPDVARRVELFIDRHASLIADELRIGVEGRRS